jgi:succinate dehydrogenase / fumarate reductase cytochrome b subunit
MHERTPTVTQASASASTPPAPSGIGGRHHFLLRRLHSLTGIVPVGVFVIFHLFTNFQMVRPGAFQHEVNFIHAMPALLFLEILIWLAIGFHAALGIVYTVVGAKPNASTYPYWDNWRYTLQRATGIVALVFIFLHIATLRWRWDIFGWFDPFYVSGLGPGGNEVPLAHASTAAALQTGWLVVLLYVVGAMSVVFHWSNGLWTAAITWGLTISERAQKRWAWVCGGLCVALTVFFAGAIYGALGYELSRTERFAIEYAKLSEQGAHPHAHAGGEPHLDPAIVERVNAKLQAAGGAGAGAGAGAGGGANEPHGR